MGLVLGGGYEAELLPAHDEALEDALETVMDVAEDENEDGEEENEDGPGGEGNASAGAPGTDSD